MDWTHCKKLIGFELKNTPFYFYLLHIFMALVYGWLFAILLPGSMLENQTTMVVDFFLLIGLTVNIYLTRPHSFFVREVKSSLYAAPIQILLRQMPVSRKTIIVSRMLMSILLSFFFSVLFTGSFYYFLEGGDLAALFPNFAWFAAAWVILVIASSGSIAAAEPGDYITKPTLYLWSIMTFGGFFLLSLLVRFISGKFLMEWIVTGAAQAPVLLISVLLLFTAGSIYFWVLYMKRYLTKTDYHV
ncbi:hypothetical protein MM300_07780 [Evansella sp. LMS18]|jgi:uncharacterized membrane protein|uniref:hypothetical protein n=1 Tax=Evansella sp. LMS18 TaxID=2924033 RepID=UPI0020D0834C|nr:hypothetical protein [Evansella sp. LMS18]UTR12179.1 hypothetical protein MM300_07780 [Evansella sp. LMS18]